MKIAQQKITRIIQVQGRFFSDQTNHESKIVVFFIEESSL